MKVPITVRTISISIAAVATAFVCGIAVTSHQQTVAPFLGSYKAASTTTTDPSTTTAQVTTTAPASTTTPSTTTSTPLVTASPSSITSTPTDTSNTQTATQSGSSAPVAPAVTAVSATLDDWTTPVARTDMKPAGTTESDQYCLWIYSDGTQQQRLYQSRYYNANGTVTADINSGFDCSITAAPPAN